MRKFEKPEIDDILALTPMQEGIFFHYLMDPEGKVYVEQLTLNLKGPMDTGRFQQAWQAVIQANEMLRVVFRWQKMKDPVQVILKDHYPNLRYYDLSGETTEKEERLDKIKTRDSEEKFDLTRVPFRLTLGKLEDNHHAMLLSYHHILLDGWSTGIILEEFFNAYDEGARGKAKEKPAQPPLKAKFREYIKAVQTRDIKKEEQFWNAYFHGFSGPTGLSIKATQPGNGNPTRPHTETQRIRFPRQLQDDLEAFALEHKLTLASLLYGSWGILLQKYNNIDDVVFGTTVSGRSLKIQGIENTVGLLINTLPLRVRNSGAEKIAGLLSGINQALQAREKYQHTPLLKIKEIALGNKGPELFDSLLVIENYPLERVLHREPGNSSLQPDTYSMLEASPYDLAAAITLRPDMEVTLLFHSHLFHQETIMRLSRHWLSILHYSCKNPGKRINEIDILSVEEKKQLLVDFNNTRAKYPADRTIPGLFEEQVERKPHRVALVGKLQITNYKSQLTNYTQRGEIQLSYGELHEKSNRLGYLLIQKGVVPDTIVAVMVERTVEMIIGLLGILKAGGAYLPLDPEYPGERIRYLLKDSGTKMLITTGTLVEEGEKVRRWQGEIYYIEELLSSSHPLTFLPSHLLTLSPSYLQNTSNPVTGHRPPATGNQFPATGHWPPATSLAYVIYTSGTTGKPKGTLTNHYNAVRVVKNTNYLEIKETDRVLQLSNYAFDGSIFDIYGALLNGAVLVLIEKENVIAVDRLAARVKSEAVTLFFITTALFNALVDVRIDCFARVRKVLFGGERVSVEHAGKALSYLGKDKIIHVYGPTETTVYATYYFINELTGDATTIPIGKPLSNTTAFILAKTLQPVPLEVNGELYIGGDGVARGYLNNPELTRERFVSFFNRSYKSNRSYILYKTGDLTRWLSNGHIEFLGRIDRQVKIRGFRVEPAEIQYQLVKLDIIKDAVVVPKEMPGQDRVLCAYIVFKPPVDDGLDQARQHLCRVLPYYMIPSYFMPLAVIPLTPNGKVDLKALPEPARKPGGGYHPPANEREKILLDIWSEVLNIEKDRLGVNDNFFELGGHSLKATMMAARIHKVLNIDIPLAEVFRAPTIKELAELTGTRNGFTPLKGSNPAAVEKRDYYQLASAQKRLVIQQQIEPDSLTYSMSALVTLQGETGRQSWEEIFSQLIRRHQGFRTFFAWVEDEPVQRIQPEVEFEIEYYLAKGTGDDDNSPDVPGSRELRAKDCIYSFIRPFDLGQAPLLRVGLIDLEEKTRLLMVDMHHIISDAMSLGVLIHEFMALYEGKTLPQPRLQYYDFSAWQNSQKKSETFRKQEIYWLNKLAGEIPTLLLPLDFKRPELRSFAGARCNGVLEIEETAALRQLAREQGMSLFMLLLALYAIFLEKISGQEEILVGTAIAGRRHPDVEQIIGMFVNTLVSRNYPCEEKTVREFFQEVKETTLQALENQDYPYDELVEKVCRDREANRNPLFEVRFKMDHFELPTLEVPGLKLVPRPIENNTAKFDLTLAVRETRDTLDFEFEYCTALFKENTIRRFFAYIRQVAAAVVQNPGMKIGDIDIAHGLLPAGAGISLSELEF